MKNKKTSGLAGESKNANERDFGIPSTVFAEPETGMKFSVHTNVFPGEPKPQTHAAIMKRVADEWSKKSDFFIFVFLPPDILSAEQDTTAYIVGCLPVREFLSKAKFYEPGDLLDGLRLSEPVYAIQIRELTSTESISEKSDDGKYNFTESGLLYLKKQKIINAIAGPNNGNCYALTYGAILHVTQLTEIELNPILAELINSDEAELGILDSSPEITIFTLPGSGSRHLLGAPDEVPGDHADTIKELKKLIHSTVRPRACS